MSEKSKIYRYPGSSPFTREYEKLFFGRDEDIARLSTFIRVEKISVLYGKSGLGKTSLLNAGTLPRLEREHRFLIIPLRFGSFTEETPQYPLDIVKEKLSRFAKENISGYSPQGSFLNKIEPLNISLWQQCKNMQLALEDGARIVLVFDQFEELFTYTDGVDEFAAALADLLYNRMPKNFDAMLRLATRKNPDFLSEEEWKRLERPVNLKILMSIRSDKMSQLDSLSSYIPNILHHCYELKPLSRAQAEAAITRPADKPFSDDANVAFFSHPFTYTPEALNKILDYLTDNNKKNVESFQLQVLCQHVEENIVIKKNTTLVEETDLGDLPKIYQNYYDHSIANVGSEQEQKSARIFIEEGLIFEEEQRRVSLYEGLIFKKYNISRELLQKLVNTHLIRAEPSPTGGFSYELSHDTLVLPILKSKARRTELERKEAERQAAIQREQKRRKERKKRLKIIRQRIVAGFSAL
ncbi:MAG: hypothetical protein ACE5I1_09305, partial [bacterium]